MTLEHLDADFKGLDKLLFSLSCMFCDRAEQYVSVSLSAVLLHVVCVLPLYSYYHCYY